LPRCLQGSRARRGGAAGRQRIRRGHLPLVDQTTAGVAAPSSDNTAPFT
jgi:hypothetical protein